MFDYQAKLEAVTDGDTCRYLIDMGMYIRSSQAIRLLGVYAPERSKPGGKDAAQFVIDWHKAHSHGITQWYYRIATQKDTQTFNRYIGVVTCATCNACLNVEINEYLQLHPEWGGGTGSES